MIIGLNDKRGRVMVNTDQILFFRSTDDGSTEVAISGGAFLYVTENMFDIVERIDRGTDYYAEDGGWPALSTGGVNA